MAQRNGLNPARFEIAVICALPRELDAVRAQFEEDFGDIELENDDDPGIYKAGRLGKHWIVATLMPGMGKKEAASTAAHFSRSFPNIRLGLLVGVCAGAPKNQEGDDIILGDVIISTAVIQYDFGREHEDHFVRKNTVSENLPRPNTRIRIFLRNFETEDETYQLQQSTRNHLNIFLQDPNRDRTLWHYPGASNDKLFLDGYLHQHSEADTCALCATNPPICDAASEAQEKDCASLGCDPVKLVSRPRLEQANQPGGVAPVPVIHFGLVASGDRVLRSSSMRRALNHNEKVIGFEMEGAGVWDHFQTIVIKGVCDYGDSHKNKGWQRYASATAASCMKAVLEKWQSHTRPEEPQLVVPSNGGHFSDKDADFSKGRQSETTRNTFSGTFTSGGRMSMNDRYNSGGGTMHIS